MAKRIPCVLAAVTMTACSDPAPPGQGAGVAGPPPAGEMTATDVAAPPMEGGTPDAGASAQSLAVEVQTPDALTVELVTLACPGDCVTLQAVASGGYPPYTYTWGDGNRDAVRTLCPEQTSRLFVAVRDTGIATPEFQVEPARAQADVTARVMECDGSPVDAGASADAITHDGGAMGDAGMCENLSNPACSTGPLSESLVRSGSVADADLGERGRLVRVYVEALSEEDRDVVFDFHHSEQMCQTGGNLLDVTLAPGESHTEVACVRPLGGLFGTSWLTLSSRWASPQLGASPPGFASQVELCGSCP